MTVSELIELLKTMPQDVPVFSLTDKAPGHTGEVTSDSVEYVEVDPYDRGCYVYIDAA